jgi:hypothetical protein
MLPDLVLGGHHIDVPLQQEGPGMALPWETSDEIETSRVRGLPMVGTESRNRNLAQKGHGTLENS